MNPKHRWALLLATSLALCLSLSACLFGHSVSNQEVTLNLGNLTATPAQVDFDGQDAVGTTRTLNVTVPAGVRGTVNASNLDLFAIGVLPPGLDVSARIPGSAGSGDGRLNCGWGLGSGYCGVGSDVVIRNFEVTLVTDGPLVPGRYTLKLRAWLCAALEEDLNGTTTPCTNSDLDVVVAVAGAAAPVAPQALAAEALGPTRVRLSWAASTEPDSYLLERALTGAAFAPAATLTAPATSTIDEGLSAATTYSYRLTPRNAAGSGPPATVTVTTLASSNGNLVLSVVGDGAGTVVSQPAGIACPSACSLIAPLGVQITLSATAAPGSHFDGFSGDADCSDGVIATATVVNCIARFTLVPQASGWQQLGSDLAPTNASQPQLAIDRNGVLHAAFLQDVGARVELLVRRFDGSAWQSVGPGPVPTSLGGGAKSVGLVMDAANRPVVAWDDGATVQVARFEGSSWQAVGAPLRSGAGSAAGVLLEARGATLVAAWIESLNGQARPALRRFDGVAWGPDLVPPLTDVSSCQLRLDSAGLAVLACVPRATPEPQLMALREDAALGWEPLDGSFAAAVGQLNSARHTGFALALPVGSGGTTGAPVLASSRDDRYAYAKARGGAGWLPAGRPNGVLDPDGVIADLSGNDSFLKAMAPVRSDGVALVTVAGRTRAGLPSLVQLMVLDGNDWITLYEPLLVPGVAAPPAAVFDVQARPIVATVENASLVPPGAIRVYRYNP